MPAPLLKPLHMGKCLQDLKPHYDKDLPSKNVKLLCSSAEKMLEKAKAEEARGNQEESYIFFMKYLNVITFVQTSQKTKKMPDIQVSKRALQYALEAAERLSQCLQKRYQKAKEERAELEIAQHKTEVEIKESMQQIKLVEEKKNSLNMLPELAISRDRISSIELNKILEERPSDVLIMDVRPRNQFSDSHMKTDSCISVPEEILDRGSSASKLAQNLPEESKSKWSKRLDVEFLVLMDWFSSSKNPQPESALHTLKTIMLEWDPSVSYRSKPLFLDGGYEDWLNHYPMHCTNAKPQLPLQNFDDLLHIDDVHYPELTDETPKFSRETKPMSKQISKIGFGHVGEKETIQSKDISSNDGQNRHVFPEISSDEKEAPSHLSNSNVPSGKPSIPSVDRSSKVVAMQKYKDLEDKRFQGMQSSKEISRNKEIAENELEKLRAQQSRNELTVKERSTLHQNEINLQLRIDELQKSQQKKDEENELLRRELEAYKKRVQAVGLDTLSLGGESDLQSEKNKSIEEVEESSLVRQKAYPSTPTSVRQIDLAVPSSGSSLKRSRSSPNIAQLVQEPEAEHKPFQPHVDRKTKPTSQKAPSSESRRNFHEVYGNVMSGLTGLKNLGNSCYMNSVLQCISNINVLTRYFCNGSYIKDINRSPSNPTRGEVAEEVAHVIRNLWMGQYRSIACRDFKAVVGKYMDQFRGCGQQDAHEFLTFLMDWLHNDLRVQRDEICSEVNNSVNKKNANVDAVTGAGNAWNDFRRKNESFMLTAFFIQQVSTVQCSSCSVKSLNFEEPTSNLTLLLPSAARCSLADCLRLYTSKERITGYKCESCHGLHDAEKSVDLCRLPPTLIIHLKRFYSDGFYQKRQTFVDFPLENLDMKSYTLNTHQTYSVYNLCAVSNHYGTLEGGHYTAYCKNGSRWYKYDDQDVSEISPNDVKSANAYILFYAAVK